MNKLIHFSSSHYRPRAPGCFPDDLMRRVVIKSVALESILGHMTEYPVTTLEAGIVLIADGCDMEKGRSRIPLLLRQESRMGDIHKYSSSAIETVSIEKGEEKPLKITVEMTASVGFPGGGNTHGKDHGKHSKALY